MYAHIDPKQIDLIDAQINQKIMLSGGKGYKTSQQLFSESGIKGSLDQFLADIKTTLEDNNSYRLRNAGKNNDMATLKNQLAAKFGTKNDADFNMVLNKLYKQIDLISVKKNRSNKSMFSFSTDKNADQLLLLTSQLRLIDPFLMSDKGEMVLAKFTESNPAPALLMKQAQFVHNVLIGNVLAEVAQMELALSSGDLYKSAIAPQSFN